MDKSARSVKLRQCPILHIVKFIYYSIFAHTFCNFEIIYSFSTVNISQTVKKISLHYYGLQIERRVWLTVDIFTLALFTLTIFKCHCCSQTVGLSNVNFDVDKGTCVTKFQQDH